MSTNFNSLPINLRYLLLEAKNRGYSIDVMPRVSMQHKDIYRIKNNEKIMIVIANGLYPDLSYVAYILSGHKFFTYSIMKTFGAKVPKSFLFHSIKQAENIWVKKFNKKNVVLKPEDSDEGVDVFVQLSKREDIKNAAKKVLKNHDGKGIIQEYIKGKDLRVQAIGGKLFAACTRVPANVVGDGKNNVAGLINAKNKIKASFSKENIIEIDNETKSLLSNQKLTLQSVPKKGQFVRLKKASNIALGGDVIDATNKLGKGFHALIENISEILLVKTFAVDMVVKDFSKPAKYAYLLEINAPCMWAHHHFAEGQKRDVASAILDSYFYPNTFNPNSEKYLLK